MGARGLLARIASGARHERASLNNVDSVIEHLRALLNTRRGDAVTVPDYGLEDLADLAEAFPDAANIWKKSIQETIERYEPRLTRVRVRHIPSENAMTIAFEISAKLVDDHRQVCMQTTVDPKGVFDIW